MDTSSAYQDVGLAAAPTQRKPSRIRTVTWTELGTLSFYALLIFLGLGGTVFFSVKHVQGYRNGFMPFYLAMLFVISTCSLICQVFVVKRRLDHELSTIQRTHSALPLTPSRGFSGFCTSSHVKTCLQFVHAYTVFLVALLVAILALFDLITGYTVSQFRPTHLLRTISLAAFQCVLLILAIAWFLVVLWLSFDKDSYSVSRCPTRTQSSKSIQLNGSPGDEVTGPRAIILNEIAVEMLAREDASGSEKKNGPFGRWGTGSAASEVSTTCPFAPGRGGSPLWEDSPEHSEDNEATSTNVQPCVIGIPSFAVVRATPALAPSNEE